MKYYIEVQLVNKKNIKLCAGCNKIISCKRYVRALGQVWHEEHFVCTICSQIFKDGTYFVTHGHPYCETHFRGSFKSLYNACNQNIKGKRLSSIRALQTEQLTCHDCHRQFNKNFCEWENKLLCGNCFCKAIRNDKDGNMKGQTDIKSNKTAVNTENKSTSVKELLNLFKKKKY